MGAAATAIAAATVDSANVVADQAKLTADQATETTDDAAAFAALTALGHPRSKSPHQCSGARNLRRFEEAEYQQEQREGKEAHELCPEP